MEYELDYIINFDKLDLYYEAHVVGLDGENFFYNIYFDGGAPTEENYREVREAISAFLKPYSENDIYMGYIDITQEEDKIRIYHDLGNVNPDDNDTSIEGILTALNNVTGIRLVLINEGCDCDFDF